MTRAIVAILFVLAGIAHFLRPAMYERITPSIFPHRLALVYISGFFEIAGGVGLLFSSLRRPAGWGLIALLIAVFPANLYMAVHADRFADLKLPVWIYWLRLPLQFVFIAGIWRIAITRGNGEADAKV